MEVVKQHAVHFFHKLLNQAPAKSSFNVALKSHLSQEDVCMLSSPVTDEEIKAAVFMAPRSKSPGPDGYPADFFSGYIVHYRE